MGNPRKDKSKRQFRREQRKKLLRDASQKDFKQLENLAITAGKLEQCERDEQELYIEFLPQN